MSISAQSWNPFGHNHHGININSENLKISSITSLINYQIKLISLLKEYSVGFHIESYYLSQRYSKCNKANYMYRQ